MVNKKKEEEKAFRIFISILFVCVSLGWVITAGLDNGQH